jgi:hypothetical protein
MHTELTDKHDFSEEPPLPPAAHFDLASIKGAKPVQQLRPRRISRYPRSVLRLGTGIFAGLMVMVLGIATMAHLNNQLNAAPATLRTSETAEATDDASPNAETESAPAAAPDSSPLVLTERRRHRGRRHIRLPREMFDLDQPPVIGPPVIGKTRARLVTVIQ